MEPSPAPAVPSDDEALILWMLSLTPTQRLEVAQGFVDSVLALRNGRLTHPASLRRLSKLALLPDFVSRFSLIPTP